MIGIKREYCFNCLNPKTKDLKILYRLMTEHLSWVSNALVQIDLDEAKNIMMEEMFANGRMVELPDNRH